MLSAAKRKAPEPQVGSRTEYLLDGPVESAEQFRPFGELDHVLRELADIEVEGNQIVDLVNFSGGQFAVALRHR